MFIPSLSRHVSRADAIGAVVTAALLCQWSFGTNGRLSAAEFTLLTTLVPLTLLWGRVLLCSLGLQAFFERTFPLAFLAGSLVLGFVLAVLRLFTPFHMGQLYWGAWLLGIPCYFWFARRIGSWGSSRRGEAAGLAATVLCLIATTFWLQHLCPQRIIGPDATYMPFFNENYSNAVNTLPMACELNPRKVGSFQFAGISLPFYHFASYTFPALLVRAGGQRLLDTQASFWCPLGFFLMGLSAYLLGASWFGHKAGYWCAVATNVIPDPTYWSVDILFFSQNRLCEASPATAYAIASAAPALMLVHRGVRRRSARCIACGLVLAFLSAYFKVNIIVTILPICMFVVLAGWLRTRDKMLWRMAAGFGAAVLVAYLVGINLRSAPTFKPDWEGGKRFIEYCGIFIPPDSALRAFDPYLWSELPWVAIPARLVYLPVISLQWLLAFWAVVFLVTVVVERRITLLTGIPPVSLAVYAFLGVFLAPNENGDPWELHHRAFGWYYVLLATWSTGQTVRLLDRTRVRRFSHPYALGMLLLVIPYFVGQKIQIPQTDVVLSNGHIECADFLHFHMAPDEAYVDSEDDPWIVSTSMVERPTYVCFGPGYNFPGHGRLGPLRSERWRLIDELMAYTSAEAIREWSAKTGVRWCLLHPRTEVHWPPEILDAAVFQSRGYRVFDLPAIGRR
ncbi:MAG: hypothetical protein U1D30_24295 [Planctomycetota bacterium]